MKEKTSSSELHDDLLLSNRDLVLHNDDVNTFDHVILTLIEVCSHEPDQAEQCAWFVHTKGKYPVKHGSLEDLMPVCSALCDMGLAAKLEQ